MTKFKIDWDDAKETENIPPVAENNSMDSTNTTCTSNTTHATNTTASTTVTTGSSVLMDPIKASLLESSNSASAMEVA